MDIKVSGRKVTVTDALRSYVDEKIGGALEVFDIQPMTCDVVLRVEKNRSNPEAAVCEVTVRVRDNVVRVESADPDASSTAASARRACPWRPRPQTSPTSSTPRRRTTSSCARRSSTFRP